MIHITAMVRLRPTVVLGMGVWCVLTLASTPVEAACQERAATARIVSIDNPSIGNSVELKEASGSSFAAVHLKVKEETFVCQGDTIRVGGFGRATVAFLGSGLRLTIEQNTEWQLVPQQPATDSWIINIVRGAILFFTSQPVKLKVTTTRFVNAAVEGTEFLVRVDGARTEVAVLEGTVVLATDVAPPMRLARGESGQAFTGQAPSVPPIRIVPRNAVQWALYYEPLPLALPAGTLEQLDQVPAGDAQFYVRRASLRLGVGRIDDARDDISRAGDQNGEALALTAIIDIAQNRVDDALDHSKKALEASPQSVSAHLARSYAFQADFKLEQARDELLRIVPESSAQDRPEHAVALARLTELWLSLGYLDRARDSARRAADVAPDLARTKTVLGFADLARLDTSAARARFEEAISLESNSPLARLGLGLAMIRDGDLHGGRGELETAAALNVEDAVVRSYLGKAYFEEKNDAQAGRQLDLAKERDPKDPTPWFYDAIRQQALNSPVEALNDLQKSIELNGNRAVYRSRLLLDQDLATRTTGLASIYRDLGFDQLALSEGYKSVKDDPANPGAHRFLSDTYLALPRHESASDSELLQALLLQPLNVQPLRPRLAREGLGILGLEGPSRIGYNEFSPAFASDGLSVLADGFQGTAATRGDNLVLSGIERKFSFSAGQFHYQTDGIRPNNQLRRDIENVLVQAALSDRVSVLAEFRHSSSDEGDSNFLFDPSNFGPAFRQTEDRSRYRLGGRFDLAPGVTAVGVWTREHATSRGDFITDLYDSNQKGDFGEAAIYLSKPRFNVIAGGGYFDSHESITDTVAGSTFPVDDSATTHGNAWAYANGTPLKSLHLTLGASIDRFRSGITNRDQINPKVGLTWDIVPGSVFRAAYFETLKRSAVGGQTIEPTQIAGFNQFFDDDSATQARRLGVGFHQKISTSLFVGIEWSQRQLKVPVIFVGPPTIVVDQNWKEEFARPYVDWIVSKRIAVNVGLQRERFVRDPTASNIQQFSDLSLAKVPVEFRYFGPVGMSALLTTSFVHESGHFLDLNQELFQGSDSFAVVDAGIGWRWPGHPCVITLQIKNLFNSEFRFQDSDPTKPAFVPHRLVVGRVTFGI